MSQGPHDNDPPDDQTRPYETGGEPPEQQPGEQTGEQPPWQPPSGQPYGQPPSGEQSYGQPPPYPQQGPPQPPPAYGPPPPAYGQPPYGPPPIAGPYGAGPHAPYGVHPTTGIPYSDKQKVIAGILQIVVPFGIGRMYMGDVGIGIAQLVVTLVTCGLGALWPFIDGIIILISDDKTDAQGRPLRG